MKRIATILLPDLACELARQREDLDGRPFAITVDDNGESVADVDSGAILDAVDSLAWRYGARPGQSAAEAMAFVGNLHVVRLPLADVAHALASVAELALSYGTVASIADGTSISDGTATRDDRRRTYPGGGGAGPFDTVWLDVTGCARLVGGEDLLCAELSERVAALGHRSRVAVAPGPRIGRAVACWASAIGKTSNDPLVVPKEQSAAVMAQLPLAALPLDSDLACWLSKLGILYVGDLAQLDRSRLTHRMSQGRQSRRTSVRVVQDLLELIAGRDTMPLVAYEPPPTIFEREELEREIDSTEPLRFILKGFVARASTRLEARGQAVGHVSLQLVYDRSAARLQGVHDPLVQLDIELPIALWREEELLRTLTAKLEHVTLEAPVVEVRLELSALTEARRQQLAMGASRLDSTTLPTLLAELSAWLGADRVGTLQIANSHRPEARSVLLPWSDSAPKKKSTPPAPVPLFFTEPTRLLPCPLPIGSIQPGSLISLPLKNAQPGNVFVLDGLRLSSRIDVVEWWTASPVCRDYARAWIHADDQHSQAWIYRDRRTGQAYLHGWF